MSDPPRGARRHISTQPTRRPSDDAHPARALGRSRSSSERPTYCHNEVNLRDNQEGLRLMMQLTNDSSALASSWQPFQLMTQLNVLDQFPLETYRATAVNPAQYFDPFRSAAHRVRCRMGYREGEGSPFGSEGAVGSNAAGAVQLVIRQGQPDHRAAGDRVVEGAGS